MLPELPMDPESYLPVNPRDYLILFALSSGRRHGYGIVKEVERDSGAMVRLDPANLYRSIKRLIRDGLVTDEDQPETPGGEDERRRYYAITETGRRVVALEAVRLAVLADAARARNLIGRPGEDS